MRKDTIAGITLIVFGVFVGGIIISIGVRNIIIPSFVVILSGVYFLVRASITSKKEHQDQDSIVPVDSLFFEKSRLGMMLIGLLLFLTGVFSIRSLPGVILLLGGAWMAFSAYRKWQ